MSDSSLLLEEIARKAGCPFLSDLHQPEKAAKVIDAIETLPYGVYTLSGWICTAEYITRQKCGLTSEEQIRSHLMEYCRNT